MQSINFPGDCLLHVQGKKRKPNGCIGYGDFLVISFSQGAYLTYDNPNAFTKPLTSGYFGYNDTCKLGAVLVSSPASSADQTVTLTFYGDLGGPPHEYVLAVQSLATCPAKACPPSAKKK